MMDDYGIFCINKGFHEGKELISTIGTLPYNGKIWLICSCSCGTMFLWRSNKEAIPYPKENKQEGNKND